MVCNRKFSGREKRTAISNSNALLTRAVHGVGCPIELMTVAIFAAEIRTGYGDAGRLASVPSEHLGAARVIGW